MFGRRAVGSAIPRSTSWRSKHSVRRQKASAYPKELPTANRRGAVRRLRACDKLKSLWFYRKPAWTEKARKQWAALARIRPQGLAAREAVSRSRCEKSVFSETDSQRKKATEQASEASSPQRLKTWCCWQRLPSAIATSHSKGDRSGRSIAPELRRDILQQRYGLSAVGVEARSTTVLRCVCP